MFFSALNKFLKVSQRLPEDSKSAPIISGAHILLVLHYQPKLLPAQPIPVTDYFSKGYYLH